MSLIKLFCDVDDFVKTITTWPDHRLLGHSNNPGPKPKLSASEIMTILIYFHMSRYRDFKTYYTQYVQRHLRSEFPQLVSGGNNLGTAFLVSGWPSYYLAVVHDTAKHL